MSPAPALASAATTKARLSSPDAPPAATSRLLTREACALLACGKEALRELAASRGVSPDARGTWPHEKVLAWSNDPSVAEWLRRNRRVGPAKARELLQVSERDWQWLLRRDVITPVDWVPNPFSRQAGNMAVFRIGDLENLNADQPAQNVPGLDRTWAQVRAVPAGRPSALAVPSSTQKPPTIGTILRAWHRTHGAQWPGLLLAWDRCEKIWTVDLSVEASDEQLPLLRRHLAEYHPALDTVSRGNRRLRVGTMYRSAIRRARHLITPGAAVVLDTETTDFDGYLVEIAVIDAATGEVLMNSLVRPGEPSSPEALAVHGIPDADAAAAPQLADLAPLLRSVIGDRTVLAYNAEFDHRVLSRHAHRDGIDLGELLNFQRWDCVMILQMDWLNSEQRIALDAAHRGLGDCLATREVLHQIATDPGARQHMA